MNRAAILAIAFLAVAHAEDPPSFDVAAIKPAQSRSEWIEVVPGSLTMRDARLSACIRWAYSIEEYQIAGPAWLDDIRFDISAKAANPVKESELRLMLQTLLAERFQLTVHRQRKEIPALILSVDKTGNKLQSVDKEGSPSFETGKLSLTGRGATLAQLTEFLSHEMHNPVIDQTGLTGRFNYHLDINAYMTEEMQKNQGPPIEAPVIIADAIRAQLGLKVDARKAPVEMLVIDHMEKMPAEN